MKKIIIVGAGFAGQGIAAKLAKKNYAITLIHDSAMISYKSLYPDVAAGRLPSGVIEYPFARYARKKRVHGINGKVTHVDFKKNELTVDGKCLVYDYLVIATGVVSNYYGANRYKKVTYTIDSADACRALSEKFNALLLSDKTPICITIVGGGYTGIEFAAHVRKRCARLRRACTITIIEREDTVLSYLPSPDREKIIAHLEKMSIGIQLNAQITDITDREVRLEEKAIPSDIVVWTAGMRGTAFADTLALENVQGRIVVDGSLQPEGLKNVFVAGDAASLYRMSVPFAKQYAVQVANNIVALDKGDPISDFKPKDYGYVIALADRRGLGRIMGCWLDGIIGYLFHYVMCCLSLLGLKNKIKLMCSIWR